MKEFDYNSTFEWFKISDYSTMIELLTHIPEEDFEVPEYEDAVMEILLPTVGLNVNSKEYVNCEIGSIDSVAVVVNAKKATLFSKTVQSVKGCGNLFLIGLCLALIFGTVIYFIGKN